MFSTVFVKKWSEMIFKTWIIRFIIETLCSKIYSVYNPQN